VRRARELVRQAHDGRPPRVLDCFAGGGNIALELLRLGCETHALDYNPVAALILKGVLEYPQRFGRPVPRLEPTPNGLAVERQVSPLAEAVERWGRWVLEEARKELERFYPSDPDGSVPVGYIWARTLPCQNPSCGAEIPLMRQTWLAKKEGRRIALRLVPDRARRRVEFQVVEGKAIDFDPEEGTVTRANVRCPICRGAIDDGTTRRLFREGKAGGRMVAVVLHHPDRPGKRYRLPTARDLEAYRAAEQALEEKRRKLWEEWGMDPVPDEKIITPCHEVDRPPMYGMPTWGDLFNPRQKLALLTFAEKVRQAHAHLLSQGAESEFAKAVATYLALSFNRLAASHNTLCRWQPAGEKIADVFSRQALPMIWDYAESNPFGESSRSWNELFKDTDGVLAHLTSIPPAEGNSDG
jgi:putative DNA methylase